MTKENEKESSSYFKNFRKVVKTNINVISKLSIIRKRPFYYSLLPFLIDKFLCYFWIDFNRSEF